LHAQTNVSGVISSNTTWTKVNSPYILTGNLLVNSGITLTIEPGVIIKVNRSLYIKVEGVVDAVGLSNSKIIFETNLSNPTDTSRNSWEGIQIRPTGGSVINNDLTHSSGTRFKNVIIKNAKTGIYVYNTGLFVQNTEFINNNYGIEFRSTNNVLVDNCIFTKNNFGTYTEYESNNSDPTSSIQNTFIQNSSFLSNTNGNYFFLNQRDFKNLNVNNNLYKENETGVIFSGGGYGCRVFSASIRYNNFIDNKKNGLEIGQIYGEGSGSGLPAYPLIVEKNAFIGNSVKWSYGGGISGVTVKFVNNIISNPNGTGLTLIGQTSRNDLFNNNYINSNLNAITIQGLYGNSYLPSNKTFSFNSISGISSAALIRTMGSGMSFTNNNFNTLQNQTILQVGDVNSVNAVNNFWGTTSLPSINAMIYDRNENFELGAATITTILSSKSTSAPISIPKNVVKSIASGRVTLTWSANQESDVSGYKIYYGGFTGYSYSNSVDAGNVLTYTLPAGVGITDEIAITAYDASKDGTDDQFDGNESWYSPANLSVSAPTNLVADAGPRNIKLNWTASSSSGVNKYNVYKSTDGINYTLSSSSRNIFTTEESITPGVTYYFKVTAFDSLDLSYDNYGLESPFSNVVSAVPTNRIYVNRVTGNDQNNGSISNPVAKLQIGLNKALNGDTLILSDHNYTERVTITGAGKSITIGSQYMFDYDTTHIASSSLDGTGFLTSHTLISSTASLSIHGITIKNMFGMGIDCSAGTILSLNKVLISNLGFNNANVSEYVFNAPKIHVDSTRMFGNHDISGLFNVQDSVSVKNSDFNNNEAGLLYYSTSGGSNKAFLFNSSFSNNKRVSRAEYLIHNVRSLIAQKNKFQNNTLTLISGSGAAYQRFENNLFYKNNSVIQRGPQMSSSDSLIIYHNTFIANGTDMSFNLSGKWKGLFFNNIITGPVNFNGPTPSRGDYISIEIRGNIFKTIPTFSYVDTLSSLNVTRDKILFKDTAILDYRLSNTNPDLGLGFESTYPIYGDLLGNARPNPVGSKPDIGAYENEFSFAAPILTKTEPGNKKVELFWTQTPNSNIKGYKVYRSTSSIPDNSNSTFLADVSGVGNLTYIDQSIGIVNRTTYYYRLKAVHNDNTLSGFGNELKAIPDDVAVPTDFKLNNSPASARLGWTPPSQLVGSKYQLFRGANINTRTLLVDSLITNTYDDVTLSRNTSYLYWIKAMDTTGALSEFSAPITLTPTNIWFVDSAIGNDNLGIGSESAPYKKISKSVSNSINFDSIYIKDGTYTENISYRDKQLSFIGVNGATKVVLKPLLASQIMAVTQNGAKSLFKGLTFANGGNSSGSAIYTQTSNPIIENCIFRDNGINSSGSILQLNRNNFIIKNCIVYNNSSNVFLDLSNGLDSIPYIYNLTYANNTNRWFYATGITTFPPTFINCIIWDASTIAYQGGMSVENSIIKGSLPGTNTNLNVSPNFVDSVNNNFRLKDFSPAIGLGSSQTSIDKDFEGNNRSLPPGSSPDAGAFENIYDHPAPFIGTDSSRNGIILLKMSQTPVGSVNKISVYKGIAPSPTVKYSDTTLVSRYPDSLNSIFNKVLYYRLTSTGSNNLESGYSNEIRTIAFTPPNLNFPANRSVRTDTAINFQWEKIDNASNYKIQFSTDSNFVSGVIDVSKTDTSLLRNGFIDNTTYFWRLQTSDTVHFSRWSNISRFQTFVRKPILNNITTTNNNITINWTVNNSRNLRAFKIYRGTSANPTVKLDSISASIFSYTDTVANGIKYFYRITAINTDNIESDYSNELFANSFNGTSLDTPINNKIKEQLKPTFKWRSVQDATKYNLQLSADSVFGSTSIVDTTISGVSLFYSKGLADNTTFFWRVRAGDDKGFSNWTKFNSFQTFVLPASLLRVTPSNKRDTLVWSVQSPNNIKYFKIYRDTARNPVKLLDSIAGSLRTYIDTNGLKLNIKYYYRIVSGNNQNIESDYSNELSATPFNTLPKAVSLSNKTFNNVGEFNFVRTNYTAVGSVDPDGQINSYKWFVNDSLINDKDSILINFFNQGTNKVKLLIADNDGGKDSSSAIVNLSSFVKSFQGGFLGGIAALSPNIIYTADSTYSPINGASISRLDRNGNTVYPLVVSSKIFTTPSVSSDSSVFITSGSSLNGFNKSGAPLWSTIPLGGLSYVTPTIDSLLSRIYVGVSNKNFFAIDYKTGKVVWNLIGDAPVNASAIITGDRKLVFTSQAGTLYGFDIRTNIVQTAPKWTTNFGEVVTKSPAVDANNNLIIGTETGKVLKVTLNDDGTITRAWSVSVNASIQSSPVIDGDGFIYVGNAVGDFYKLDANNGTIVWKYETGAAIKSTPTISEFGNIYISNTNGLVTAITTNKTLKWTYQADGPISANMLYINNMIYIGTERGKFLAIYDNPSTNTVNTSLSMNLDKNRLKTYSYGSLASASPINFDKHYDYYYDAYKQGKFNLVYIDTVKAKEPVWGTFQGNFRRTGSKKFECPETPVIQVPNCATPSDSIRISTNTMTNRYWIVNDVKLTNETSNSIVVKTSDKFKLMAFNSVGCEVLSIDPTLAPNSNISKPEILTNNGTGKICEGDSLVLSSSIDAAKYQWNYAGAAITNQKSKNFKTTLAGAYSLTVINNFGCSATSDLQLVMVNKIPNSPIVTPVVYCLNSTPTQVSAVNSNTDTLVWYNSATGGVGSRIAPTANTSNIGTVSYYVSQINNNGCESSRSKLDVNVVATPSAPLVSPITICVGSTSASLNATISAGNSLLWYGNSAIGGTGSNVAPIPSTSTTGTVSYYVSQINNNGCESPRSKLDVTVVAPPSAPLVSPITICVGSTSTALNATSSAGNSLLWYGNSATGGTGSNVAPIPSTSTTGTFSYYVSQINNNGCESPRSKLDVTVVASPSAPLVSPIAICVGSSSTALNATSSAGNSLLWYGNSATGGTGSSVAPIPSTSAIGIVSYYVSQINNSGCESPRSKLDVTITNPPAKPTISAAGSTSFCTGGNVVLNSSSGSGNQWYKDGQIINGANLASYTASISGKYSVGVTSSGDCVVMSDDTQVSSDVSTSLTVPVINSMNFDSTICFKDSLVLRSSTFYDKYLWSNGDTTSSTVIRNSAKVSLRGRYNGSTCFSLPSVTATAVKNLNVIPEISSQLNSLVSTNSNNYKWFKNNLIVPGVTANVLFNPSIGVYRVETSLDKFCWDASPDFMIITNNQPIVTDTVQLTVFPNPSSGIFNVVADFEKVTNVVTKVTVVDINGVMVYQSQRLLFFSNKIMLPVNLGTRKGVFGVHMDINGIVKSIVVVVN
jgi:fibronectin type 3 domain-containing protein